MPILDRKNRRQPRQHSYENGRPDVASSPSPTQSTNYASTTQMHSGKPPTYRQLAGKKDSLRIQQASTKSQQGAMKQRSISPVGDVAVNEDWVDEYEQFGNVFQNGNTEDEEFLVNSSDHSFCFNQQDEDFINFGSMSPKQNDTRHPFQQGLVSKKQSQIPRGPRKNGKFNPELKENSDSNIPRPLMKQSTSSDSTSSSRSQSGNSITNSIQRWQLRTQNVLFSGVSGRGMSSSIQSTDSRGPSMSMDTNSITSEIQEAEVLQQQQQDSDASSAGSSKYIPLKRASSPAASVSSVSIEDFITGDENVRIRGGSRTPSEVSFEFQQVESSEEETSVQQVNANGQNKILWTKKQQNKFVESHRNTLWQRSIAALFCILICLAAGFMPQFWVGGNKQIFGLSSQQLNSVIPQTIFLHGFSTEMRWVKHAFSHVLEAMDQHYPIVETTHSKNQQNIPANNGHVDDQGSSNSMSGSKVHEMHVEQQLQLAQKIGQIQQVVSSSSPSPQQPSLSSSSLTSQFTTGNTQQQKSEVLSAQQQNEEAAQIESAGLSSSQEDQSSIPDDTTTTPQIKSYQKTLEERTPQQQKYQPTHHNSWSSPFASVKSTPSQQNTHTYKSHVKSAIRNFKEQITNSVLGPWVLSFLLAIIIVVGAGSFFSDLGDWIIENVQNYNGNKTALNNSFRKTKSKNGYSNHVRNYSGYSNKNNNQYQFQDGRKSSSGDYTRMNFYSNQNGFDNDFALQQQFQKQHQAKIKQSQFLQQQDTNNNINNNDSIYINNNYQTKSTFQSCRQNSLISRYYTMDEENNVPEEIMDTASTPRRKSKRILQNHRP